jgi:hypothetical protein
MWKIGILFTVVTLMCPFRATSAQTADTLLLSSGWNFISFPKDPPDRAPSEVLKEISPNVAVVWGYDNTNKTWLKYKQGTASSLTTLKPGRGYWLYLNDSSATITMTTWSAPQVSENLKPGWNLIGYTGPDGISGTDAAKSISDPWSIIWNWTGGTWYGLAASLTLPSSVAPLTIVYQGKAYWIKVRLSSGSVGTWDSSLWDNGLWGP